MLFSHPTLVSLTLQDLVFWGSGSGKVVAENLRRNSKLETLELRSCGLAGDSSILSGLGGNATLQRLDMTDADLSMEAPAMAKALVKNKVLQSCILCKTYLGGDEKTLHSNLCNIIRALESHPTMTELAMQGMHSYIYEDGSRPVTFIRLALDIIIKVLERDRVPHGRGRARRVSGFTEIGRELFPGFEPIGILGTLAGWKRQDGMVGIYDEC
jgi:hypothetical protein